MKQESLRFIRPSGLRISRPTPTPFREKSQHSLRTETAFIVYRRSDPLKEASALCSISSISRQRYYFSLAPQESSSTSYYPPTLPFRDFRWFLKRGLSLCAGSVIGKREPGHLWLGGQSLIARPFRCKKPWVPAKLIGQYYCLNQIRTFEVCMHIPLCSRPDGGRSVPSDCSCSTKSRWLIV